jgi:hypothetical protein
MSRVSDAIEKSGRGRTIFLPQFTPQATEDLDATWSFISEHSRDAVDGWK